VTPPGTRRLEVTNGHSAALLARLRNQPGVREATIFGQAVHALVDADRTNEQLGLAGLKVRESEANLEDVFVTLSRLRQAS
jgi:ABC-2 type transport system ATP-binding protein